MGCVSAPHSILGEPAERASRGVNGQTGSSWSAWYRSRQSERWSLPDEVFGSVPGRTSTTSTGGTPTASRDRGRHGVAQRGGVVGLGLGDDDDRLPALAARSLAERDDVAGAHAVDRAAARSMSSGNRLRPPTMIMSFRRPHTTSWPSTRYARSPVRSQPSRNVPAVGGLVAVVAGRHRRAAELELADFAVAELVPGLRVHDAQLEPAQRAAEQRQSAVPFGGVAGAGAA